MDKQILRKLQETEYDILCAYDDFCRKQHLEYTLYAGSLLGAIRHKGFIPWDDDIDVAMTRAEYTKFCEMIKKEPMDGYFLDNCVTNKKCGTSHGRLRKKNTLMLQKGEIESIGTHEIFIDIFPLDKMSREKLLEEKTKKIGKKIVMMTRANVAMLDDSFIKRMVRYLYRLIPPKYRYRQLIKSVKQLQLMDEKVARDYVWCSMSTLNNIKKIRFPYDVMEKYIQIEFNGRLFHSTAKWDSMLTILFGDYMQLPPESERVCKHNPLKIEFQE